LSFACTLLFCIDFSYFALLLSLSKVLFDIAFINGTLVFSFKHLFLTGTDLASRAREINISKKIQK